MVSESWAPEKQNWSSMIKNGTPVTSYVSCASEISARTASFSWCGRGVRTGAGCNMRAHHKRYLITIEEGLCILESHLFGNASQQFAVSNVVIGLKLYGGKAGERPMLLTKTSQYVHRHGTGLPPFHLACHFGRPRG